MKLDHISGTLTAIRYHQNGFLIGSLQAEKKSIAVLGNMLSAEIGQKFKLFGKWSTDPKWGKQYKFKTHEAIIPKSTDGIYRYIVRIARWVGPKVGRAMIDQYGADTLDILREFPERVAADIKGITAARAKEIQTHIIQNQEIEGALVELEKLIGGAGLRQSLPMDLVQKWGGDAVTMLKENPYRLIDFKQIGFPSADRIAVDRFKVEPQSVFRQQAAVIHALRDKTHNEGHVWVDTRELVDEVKGMIRCNPGEGLARAIEKGAVVQEGGLVAMVAMARDEAYVAGKVKELLR